MLKRADEGAAARRVERVPSTLGGLAVQLLGLAREAGGRGVVRVAAGEDRAEALARALRGLDSDLDVLLLPAWDCLPYDRASPSREAMGRRAAALIRLTNGSDRPRIVLTTVDAVMQRVPPRSAWGHARVRLATGENLALDALQAFLARTGYRVDERVDEPGEAAIRGGVIDLFPPASSGPVRIEHQDERITQIRTYDPVSQRTVEEVDALTLLPASEVILPDPEDDAQARERFPGMEHWLADFYPELETLFDYMPEATVVLGPQTEERRVALEEQIRDAYESRRAWAGRRQAGEGMARGAPLPPDRIAMNAAEWEERLGRHPVVRLRAPPEGEADDAVPRFATAPAPLKAFVAFVDEALKAGTKIVLATIGKRDRNALARRLSDRLKVAPTPVPDWDGARAAPPGSLLSLEIDLDEGFRAEADGIVVIAAADLIGSRAEHEAMPGSGQTALPLGDVELRLGDAVVHVDHGMAALRGLESVAAPDSEASSEMIRLEYANEAKLLMPVEEAGDIWRYGAAADTVTLDRLDSDAWEKRRETLMAEIDEAAARLVAMAKERAKAEAPVLVPPARDYERFSARFPFSLTRDQARAIRDALKDLASGRPMDRLVCGDVGFGKTEVALRAAAAAALAGKQVAVVAPTTILVRQHVETFRKRFAGLGIEIGHLSRLVSAADARAVKAGLASGDIRVIVGTHAVASRTVRFKDLELLVIDEEQRFGVKQKARLRETARGLHVLTLTATPIPRTLQAAIVGLKDLSVIATPPARRQGVRTFLMPFDPVTLREALLRERGRGGQSFVVCPRIEDIAPMAAQLKRLVPELEVMVAHGDMPADEIDDSMVRFAQGEGDVLLATNIIESGLDVPCANTILVWRADRFGLAQLHQLRGRVGRGRLRGVAYLLTDPQAKISDATLERLRTLEALDRLGAGFLISARDLDLRGAGDLLGESQAGHMKLVGVGLYEHLLRRAIAAASGRRLPDEEAPEIHLDATGRIPEDYVPEPEVRLNLYARLARLATAARIDSLADEIEDRFGPMPQEVADLIGNARLRRLCRVAGVARLDAGPQAVALTFRDGARDETAIGVALEEWRAALEWRGERLVVRQPSDTAEERRDLALRLAEALAAEG